MLSLACLMMVIGAARAFTASRYDFIEQRHSAAILTAGFYALSDWGVDAFGARSGTMLLLQEISFSGLFLTLGAIGVEMLDWDPRKWSTLVAGLAVIVIGANRIGNEADGTFTWLAATDWTSRIGHAASIATAALGSALLLAGARRAWPPMDRADRLSLLTTGGAGLIGAIWALVFGTELLITPELLARHWHADEWMWAWSGYILLAISGLVGLTRTILRWLRPDPLT